MRRNGLGRREGPCCPHLLPVPAAHMLGCGSTLSPWPSCSSFCSQLHMVHWNPKHGNFAPALKQRDGVAVVGVFLLERSQLPLFVPYSYHSLESFLAFHPTLAKQAVVIKWS
uniref:Uncharacterized protein n=1 Tax=Crocodylus porosus TaxID=8502 RepID=A0A7M4DXI0_CROPO